ncbi:hypothetical protein DIE15_00880 [Burkholderia sp. Bp9031]|nr:hypothetical protein DIE15_00880 [Burkholderia sp. Bp9031]
MVFVTRALSIAAIPIDRGARCRSDACEDACREDVEHIATRVVYHVGTSARAQRHRRTQTARNAQPGRVMRGRASCPAWQEA